jgi:hypothetical protein
MCGFGSTTEAVIPSDPELHAACVQACHSTCERRDRSREKRYESQPTKVAGSPWTYYRAEISSSVFRLRSIAHPRERQVDA